MFQYEHVIRGDEGSKVSTPVVQTGRDTEVWRLVQRGVTCLLVLQLFGPITEAFTLRQDIDRPIVQNMNRQDAGVTAALQVNVHTCM